MGRVVPVAGQMTSMHRHDFDYYFVAIQPSQLEVRAVHVQQWRNVAIIVSCYLCVCVCVCVGVW
jgi:hypothetical protein